MAWKNGTLAKATFKPSKSVPVRVRVKGASDSREIQLAAGRAFEFVP